MEDSFGPDFYTIEDEDGNTHELEPLDSVTYNDVLYHAFFPAEMEDEVDVDDEESGLIILKVIEEDGEELLSSPDTDEELEAVYELFMDRFFEEDEE
ncbi:MAG: DUF1292 domain-containing protein [Eubacteriales bacterium]